MTEREVISPRQFGFHVRPSKMIYAVTVMYPDTEIFFIKESDIYNAKSIMSLICMGIIEEGECLRVSAHGSDVTDEELVVRKICDLIEGGFK